MRSYVKTPWLSLGKLKAARFGVALALGLLSAALTGGYGAMAQAPAPTLPTLPAPAAPEPTASHLAAARELLELNGIARSFAASIPQFFDQVGTTLGQTQPELKADLNQVFIQLKPEFEKKVEELTDKSARLYASILSEQDLKAIDIFFKSEAGQKYVQTQPEFMRNIVVIMESWREQLSTDLMTRVRVEMKKKGHQL
jgi:hypothetical protein